jgi:hypothetical protein
MKTVSKTAADKIEKAKKQFLKELTGTLEDVKQAEGMTDIPFSEAFQLVKKAHGGARTGAGAKKKEIRKVQRGVKLTEPEYKFIVRKYGSFASGVRSLLPKSLD